MKPLVNDKALLSKANEHRLVVRPVSSGDRCESTVPTMRAHFYTDSYSLSLTLWSASVKKCWEQKLTLWLWRQPEDTFNFPFYVQKAEKENKTNPSFYTIYILFFFFLENSNHVLSTDLSSLPLVTGSAFFPECPVKVGKNTEQEALPCWLQPFLLSVMKNEFLVEQFAPLHHWRLASLLDSSTAEGLRYSSISKRDMQQWQLQTLREPMTPCHLLKACKLCLTVVHIWCSKYCA